jgi:DNA end-binding protein Ku
MASRPFWSGQLKISLVSFGIQMFPATSPQRRVTFHQIDRATGKRIRHLNVTGDGQPVENSDIVKGYEYSKGKYLIVEPDEVAKLRIATRNVIDVQQFVGLEEIPPALFERPYFLAPEPRESLDAFLVVREAMAQTRQAAIGEIAFDGREHLVAIAAPPDRSAPGLMAYMLRFEEELRKSDEYFGGIPGAREQHIDKRQLDMAVQLIESYSHPLNLGAFRDDYDAALRKLIEAKQKNLPMPVEEEKPKPAKVVNLMDALRQSVSTARRPAGRERRSAKPSSKKGPVLVSARRRHRAA